MVPPKNKSKKDEPLEIPDPDPDISQPSSWRRDINELTRESDASIKRENGESESDTSQDDDSISLDE